MTITLIDHQEVFVQSLKKLLLRHGCESVTTYNKLQDFIDDIAVACPDIMIMDLMAEKILFDKFIQWFKNKYPACPTKFIILTSFSDLQTVRYFINNGASCCLTKSISFKDLMDAVKAVWEGSKFIDPSLNATLLNSTILDDSAGFHLVELERQVLGLVCSGKTMKEVAEQLGLSVYSVQYHHRKLMNRFKVKRTADLIVLAIQNGFYDPGTKNNQ